MVSSRLTEYLRAEGEKRDSRFLISVSVTVCCVCLADYLVLLAREVGDLCVLGDIPLTGASFEDIWGPVVVCVGRVQAL
jgi:hypothetical protein